MPTTLTLVPAGTYAPGVYNLPAAGKINIPGGTTSCNVGLDTSNYDAGPSPEITFSCDVSRDDGATWEPQGGPMTWRGPNPVRNGVVQHKTSFGVVLDAPAPASPAWRVRVQITVAGQSYVAANPGTVVVYP